MLFSSNRSEIKKLQRIVNKINHFDFTNMSEEQLKSQTEKLRKELETGKATNDILPEAFATIREASSRILGLRHFDVQLMGGIVLHNGNVAEMKTGEGKTLVGTLPSYLNALGGKKVHVVTVNEYLAKRDYEELSPLFNFLGITSSFIHNDMSYFEKKEAYNASIIFGTNNEFGFDYLRDNMAKHTEERVQTGLDFAIVDEVDSILIDESRTPLIISGPSNQSSDILHLTSSFVKTLRKSRDFEVDEESQQCFLTEEGIAKAEKFFGIENLYSPDKIQLNHYLNQSLRAFAIMKKDKDYIVSNGEVHIIDTFTGRISKGRRFSNSLHQAIEAKEGVEIQDETVTKATVTYQNYFRLYDKLAGMTGTAETEKEELSQVYSMKTIVIPTNKPIQRKDHPDLIFAKKDNKELAIVKKVKTLHETGQPVLIGTSSIEESEEISASLTKGSIPHVVLNAKNHEREAEIIKNAGEKGAVTVATNMAGRGTDIKLAPDVQELGGLYVIGTSKNENRRVDNQLRGRSGRQGDLGNSQFYVSLEDELMIRFGANKAQSVMERMKIDEEGLESPFLTKLFTNAQKRLEGMNYDIRKRLLQYDDILSRQRKLVYQERIEIMSKDDLQPTILDLTEAVLENLISHHFEDDEIERGPEWLTALNNKISITFNCSIDVKDIDEYMKKKEYISFFKEKLANILDEKTKQIPKEIVLQLHRNIMLDNLDYLWEKHLEHLDEIRQGIHLYAYSQVDPLREYQLRAKETFDLMLMQFAETVTHIVFHIKVEN